MFTDSVKKCCVVLQVYIRVQNLVKIEDKKNSFTTSVVWCSNEVVLQSSKIQGIMPRSQTFSNEKIKKIKESSSRIDATKNTSIAVMITCSSNRGL